MQEGVVEGDLAVGEEEAVLICFCFCCGIFGSGSWGRGGRVVEDRLGGD